MSNEFLFGAMAEETPAMMPLGETSSEAWMEYINYIDEAYADYVGIKANYSRLIYEAAHCSDASRIRAITESIDPKRISDKIENVLKRIIEVIQAAMVKLKHFISEKKRRDIGKFIRSKADVIEAAGEYDEKQVAAINSYLAYSRSVTNFMDEYPNLAISDNDSLQKFAEGLKKILDDQKEGNLSGEGMFTADQSAKFIMALAKNGLDDYLFRRFKAAEVLLKSTKKQLTGKHGTTEGAQKRIAVLRNVVYALVNTMSKYFTLSNKAYAVVVNHLTNTDKAMKKDARKEAKNKTPNDKE